MPVAADAIQFGLAGPGRILGVGNGDPSCHEPDVFLAKWPTHSAPVPGWRWQRIEDPYRPNLPEVAASFDDTGWAPLDVNSASGPLGEREHGIFRAKFSVTATDLSASAVEIAFGMLDEEAWVYVNGRKAGESHDWRTAPRFDAKQLLHPGENTVAVVIANFNGAGGVNKGASLEFQEKPELPEWKRSVFNGLAQIIVQSSGEPGEIKLTARAAGLQPGMAVIRSEAVPRRAAVP